MLPYRLARAPGHHARNKMPRSSANTHVDITFDGQLRAPGSSPLGRADASLAHRAAKTPTPHGHFIDDARMRRSSPITPTGRAWAVAMVKHAHALSLDAAARLARRRRRRATPIITIACHECMGSRQLWRAVRRHLTWTTCRLVEELSCSHYSFFRAHAIFDDVEPREEKISVFDGGRARHDDERQHE